VSGFPKQASVHGKAKSYQGSAKREFDKENAESSIKIPP